MVAPYRAQPWTPLCPGVVVGGAAMAVAGARTTIPNATTAPADQRRTLTAPPGDLPPCQRGARQTNGRLSWTTRLLGVPARPRLAERVQREHLDEGPVDGAGPSDGVTAHQVALGGMPVAQVGRSRPAALADDPPQPPCPVPTAPPLDPGLAGEAEGQQLLKIGEVFRPDAILYGRTIRGRRGVQRASRRSGRSRSPVRSTGAPGRSWWR